MREFYLNLLTQWCDALVASQAKGTGIAGLDGGLYCEACGGVHGRSPDAVYPLMHMADKTGKTEYLNAAKALFDWGGQLFCDDGAVFNDHNAGWNGITVFAATSLCDALQKHGQLLDGETFSRWDERLKRMGEWLYANLKLGMATNINYFATNAAAMAVLGKRYGREDYMERARELGRHCLGFIGADGLLVGEGQPNDFVTRRGCRSVDIGYNIEESLPMLALWAKVEGDKDALECVRQSIHGHLRFLLPDGGWDNSFGTRNFKWTYWGSRTSDGFQEAAAVLGADDPVITLAAWRNAEMYARCTHGGLLYGGPHYHTHGEPPCLHHTICHAKALASVLDAKLPQPHASTKLPEPPALHHYSETDAYCARAGSFRATMNGGDFPYMNGGCATGGTLTFLWHEKTGPLIASSMTDYSLKEPTNMQLSLRKAMHRSLTPRAELSLGNVKYAQCYDGGAFLAAHDDGERVTLSASAQLKDISGKAEPRGTRCEVSYHISEQSVVIEGRIFCEDMAAARYILPLIGLHEAGCDSNSTGISYRLGEGRVTVRSASLIAGVEPIFFLAGGFEAWELSLQPDATGRFRVEIAVA